MDLSQSVNLGARATLLRGLLLDAQGEKLIMHGLDAGKGDPIAEADRSAKGRRSLLQAHRFPRVANRVGIRDVVIGDGDGSLLREQGLRGVGQDGGQTTHRFGSFSEFAGPSTEIGRCAASLLRVIRVAAEETGEEAHGLSRVLQ